MEPEKNTVTSPILGLVKTFNEEVKAHHLYYKRKNVEATPTIFFDNQNEILPQFRRSPFRWCTIPTDLTELLQKYKLSTQIVRFESNEGKKLLEDSEFLKVCNDEASEYLRLIADIYLKLQDQLANSYLPNVSVRVKEVIVRLGTELSENTYEVINKTSMIVYLKKSIKLARNRTSLATHKKSIARTPSELIHKVLELRRQGMHSVKDICTLCKISSTMSFAEEKIDTNGNSQNPEEDNLTRIVYNHMKRNIQELWSIRQKRAIPLQKRAQNQQGGFIAISQERKFTLTYLKGLVIHLSVIVMRLLLLLNQHKLLQDIKYARHQFITGKNVMCIGFDLSM
eukprot:TRINITY_DN5344_c0_g1_i2.p1 TRINITY_DN5344_c0_g1~~TRINITY_DN5344_c0_g1_i2.p1  ORF type:complete len:362 (-),score=-3.69 TRINITY_DN5344_c0_g1_i2:43-1062(-)